MIAPVNLRHHSATGGERFPSEWVKKAECRVLVQKGAFPEPATMREIGAAD